MTIWNLACGGEKQPVRATVDETASVGGAVERYGEFRGLVGGKRCYSRRLVIGLRADPENEAAVDRGRTAQRNARKLHDHTVVVQRKKRHRVLDLLGGRKDSHGKAEAEKQDIDFSFHDAGILHRFLRPRPCPRWLALQKRHEL